MSPFEISFLSWFSSSFIIGSSGTYRESSVNANPWHAERHTSTRLNIVNRLWILDLILQHTSRQPKFFGFVLLPGIHVLFSVAILHCLKIIFFLHRIHHMFYSPSLFAMLTSHLIILGFLFALYFSRASLLISPNVNALTFSLFNFATNECDKTHQYTFVWQETWWFKHGNRTSHSIFVPASPISLTENSYIAQRETSGAFGRILLTLAMSANTQPPSIPPECSRLDSDELLELYDYFHFILHLCFLFQLIGSDRCRSGSSNLYQHEFITLTSLTPVDSPSLYPQSCFYLTFGWAAVLRLLRGILPQFFCKTAAGNFVKISRWDLWIISVESWSLLDTVIYVTLPSQIVESWGQSTFLIYVTYIRIFILQHIWAGPHSYYHQGGFSILLYYNNQVFTNS